MGAQYVNSGISLNIKIKIRIDISISIDTDMNINCLRFAHPAEACRRVGEVESAKTARRARELESAS